MNRGATGKYRAIEQLDPFRPSKLCGVILGMVRYWEPGLLLYTRAPSLHQGSFSTYGSGPCPWINGGG